jgi:hypothetical protein
MQIAYISLFAVGFILHAVKVVRYHAHIDSGKCTERLRLWAESALVVIGGTCLILSPHNLLVLSVVMSLSLGVMSFMAYLNGLESWGKLVEEFSDDQRQSTNPNA